MLAEPLLGTGVASRRCLLHPLPRLSEVTRHAIVPLVQKKRQIILRVDVALIGGLAVPAHGFAGILGKAVTLSVENPNVVLCSGFALRGGLPIPAERLSITLGTPKPFSNRYPILVCAPAFPWSAALRYQRSASP